MQYINKFLICLVENNWARAGLLVVAFLLGFPLVNCLSGYIFSHLKSSMDARQYFILPMFSLPIVFALWWFRTYDTRQQIAKSQAQIEQSNFVAGIQNLIGEESMQVDIGVQILLEVSKNTDEFNTNIRLAFIKRLKELPKNSGEVKEKNKLGERIALDYKFSYAYHIIKWLKNNSDAGSLDLSGLNLRYQKFLNKDTDIKYVDIETLHDSNEYGEKPTIKMGGCIFAAEYVFFGQSRGQKEYEDDLEEIGMKY